MNAASTPNPEAVEEFVKVQSHFIRHRNCLLLTADFSPIYVDYYLHLMQQKIRHEVLEDHLLKDLLAYFTLHLVSRPWKEYHAWTLNLKEPLLANLFVSGSSLSASVIGRIFTEDVRIPEENMLFTQNICDAREPQTSVIEIPGDSVASWVEKYYQESEQRMAKTFYLGEDRYALITAQPGADHDWLAELTAAQVEEIIQSKTQEETKLLESRQFSFFCGCTVEKILPTLRTMSHEFTHLFATQGYIEISCPRCGASYRVTPDMMS